MDNDNSKNSDCLVQVFRICISEIDQKSTDYYRMFEDDIPRSHPIFSLYSGLMYLMAEKLLGVGYDGKETALIHAQLALTQTLLESDGGYPAAHVIPIAMAKLRPEVFSSSNEAADLMFSYLSISIANTPWITRQSIDDLIYYEVDPEIIIDAYKRKFGRTPSCD